ncbi:ParB N-terminal domain-containing protein [Algoriphagus persicinus]|uniref:ParB N-terminal domain-containing protein n=1 Tax=Algoriphagus persicinus TaxID=3108754 RepID=UPI002B3B80CE|nr:ParB N-terminal domain-containing protein [Algoriphagus sp. E1-3-M2]MEB2787348.1 hypothetical protein [Algoriphagus sp. E1-3-M2]
MNNTISHISPQELHFDYRNPRVAEFGFDKETGEKKIIKILWSVMGVEEIVLSIKASKFFQNEPLIAIEEEGRVIVIEGNRRLAAVKSILNPSIADELGLNRNLLTVSQEVLTSIETLPIIVVSSREDAWKFIGFKHINGPAKWGSYAKAQYISQIKNEFNIPLSEIASQIGDTHRTVEKLYQGLQVIEQAEREKLFDRTDVPSSRLFFSHLYTGLTYQGYREFISIQDSPYDTLNPVPNNKFEELSELLKWIYGSKKENQNPIIQSQNPDLRRLESVLKNKEAIIALKSGVDLITAYEISQPKRDNFEQSLLEAKRALSKAHSFQPEAFDGTDMALLKHAGTLAKLSEELYDTMYKKYEASLGKKERKWITDDE